MIGKSLTERHEQRPLPAYRAEAILREVLETQARPLVEVRARDARMIACLVVRADKLAVRLCRSLGIDIKPGATAVFGLLGTDAATLFADVAADRRGWLEAPCARRETKILLIADGGTALLSLETSSGSVAITALP